MANALPILLLGGAALMMMGGKKKPKPVVEEEADDFMDDSADDSSDEGQVSQLSVEPTMAEKCNMFIDSVWVEPDPGEIAIKTLVVEESILPAMRASAKAERKKQGEELGQDYINTLLFVGLNTIAPDCGWGLTGDGWRYADSQPFEGKVLDVAAAIKELAMAVIEETNEPIPAGFAAQPASPTPEDPKPADSPKLHIGT